VKSMGVWAGIPSHFRYFQTHCLMECFFSILRIIDAMGGAAITYSSDSSVVSHSWSPEIHSHLRCLDGVSSATGAPLSQYSAGLRVSGVD